MKVYEDRQETEVVTTVYIYICVTIGLLFSLYLFHILTRIKLPTTTESSSEGHVENSLNEGLLNESNAEISSASGKKLVEIYNAISHGADSFLFAEYRICFYFIVVFGALVLVLTSRTSETKCQIIHDLDNPDGDHAECSTSAVWNFKIGGLTAISFVLGAVTSILSGYLGMKVAVFSNARTTLSAALPFEAATSGRSGSNPWTGSFNAAFRAGAIMGLSLCSLALLVLYSLILVYKKFLHDDKSDEDDAINENSTKFNVHLFECIAGFGLGGSTIALFGRVGGGIYTKAADVGADLAGKVVHGIPEDDPRNPAVIADNVGDNVGDVAGMGSDLFGSFAESACAAMVLTSANNWPFKAQVFPLILAATSIIVCLFTSFFATNLFPVKKSKHVERVLKVQLFVSTLGMSICTIILSNLIFKNLEHDSNEAHSYQKMPTKVSICILCGLWSGCLIGFITEYYTSHSYKPVRDLANSCETGAATNIIYGLALGYKSTILPVILLSATVFLTFKLLGLYGISLAALGMLGTLATCLTIDVYGPVCDNAGGIAEMSHLGSHVREITDTLDAAGNTTAAIGKGFAIGSAAFVGLALFGAFVKRSGLDLDKDVGILQPIVIAFIIFGSMIPYWFTAMTMKSVGLAAKEMVNEVARQFNEIPGLLTAGKHSDVKADYQKCIKISTEASLRKMVAPGILIIFLPILTGSFFGAKAVCGLLTGAISSSVQLAISSANSGGAWDNAKKYIESNGLGAGKGKGSEVHKAAVVGDTVGDPLKDTSGPSLNIVMKLMAILSLVFADFFKSLNDGNGLLNLG